MARRLRARRLTVSFLAIAVITAWLGIGCDVVTGGCLEELEDEPPVTFSGGTTEDGIYRSSSWDSADWIDFPPGIAVEFEHGLGTEPRAWQAYVATARQEDGSNLVLAAGSEVELLAIDDKVVTVRNATCVDFFVVMVAMSAAPN